MATDNFDPEIDDIGISPVEGMLDDAGVFRLQTPNISSYNFDGFIGNKQLNIAASAVQPGMQISLTGSVGTQTYYTVLFVNDSDEELSASPSELVTIQYIDEDAFPQILSIGASAIISVQKENWDEKYLGENGWYIGTSGNAIFSNVAVRGRIEATEGAIEGDLTLGGSLTASTNTGQLIISSSGIFGSTASGLFHLDNIDGEVSFTGDITANSGIVKKLTIGAGTSYPIINLVGTASVTDALQSGNFILTLDSDSKNFSPGDYFYINGSNTSGSAFQDGVPTTASVFFNRLTLNKDGSWSSPYTYKIITASYGGLSDRYFCRRTQGSLIGNYDFSQVTASSGFINFGYVYFGEYSTYSLSGGTFIDGLVLSTIGPGDYFQDYVPDYIDLSGKFRLGKGNISFDGNNLLVTGGINATSGSFVGWLKSASITGGIISSGSFVGGILQSLTYSGVTDGSAFSTIGTHINLNTGAITGKQFRIDTSGNATFGGSLNAATGTFSGALSAATGTFAGSLSAATGTFSGTLSADSITSGTLDSARINVDTLTVKSLITNTQTNFSRIGIEGSTYKDKINFYSGLISGPGATEVIAPYISTQSTYSGGLIRPDTQGVTMSSGTNTIATNGAAIEVVVSRITSSRNINFYGDSFNFNGGLIYGDGSQLTNLPSGGSSPTGTIVMYGGGSAPSGWLLCDGAAVSRSTYSALWNVLGSSYGNGNGSTTFNVPNFISGGPGGTPAFARGGSTPGSTGGVQTHTLTLEQIPQHTHNVGTLAISGTSGGSGELTHSGSIDSKGAHSHTVSGQVGSGGAHSHTYTAPDAAVSSRQGTQTGGVVPGRATGTATSTEPSHQHGAGTLAADSAGSHQHTIAINAHASHTHGAGSLAISGATGNVTSRGVTDSINNQPPYIVVNFIIKT